MLSDDLIPKVDTSLIIQKMNYFSIWNSIEILKLPSLAWSLFHTQKFKIITSIQMSLHSEPETIIFKEIRVVECNTVQRFILGKPYENSTTIYSLEEFNNYLMHFHDIILCRGGPSMNMIQDISQMSNGFINRLNRWQSTNCKVQLESGDSGICLPCYNLEKALKCKQTHSKNSNCKLRLSTLLSPSKKKVYAHKLASMNKKN